VLSYTLKLLYKRGLIESLLPFLIYFTQTQRDISYRIYSIFGSVVFFVII